MRYFGREPSRRRNGTVSMCALLVRVVPLSGVRVCYRMLDCIGCDIALQHTRRLCAGYMEGAIIAGRKAANDVLKLMQ